MGRTVREMIEAALRQTKRLGPEVGCYQAFVVTRQEQLRLLDNKTIPWAWNTDRTRFCGMHLAVIVHAEGQSLVSALQTIRCAGGNEDPTAQWMQQMAAHALEPDKWPRPAPQEIPGCSTEWFTMPGTVTMSLADRVIRAVRAAARREEPRTIALSAQTEESLHADLKARGLRQQRIIRETDGPGVINTFMGLPVRLADMPDDVLMINGQTYPL